MSRLVAVVRWFHEREPVPSRVMVDAQTVKGGRYGPTFHQAGGRGGRTIGTKRTLLVAILVLPVAASACSARPHDVVAARELLRDRIETLPRLRAIVGDRAYPAKTSQRSAAALTTSPMMSRVPPTIRPGAPPTDRSADLGKPAGRPDAPCALSRRQLRSLANSIEAPTMTGVFLRVRERPSFADAVAPR